MAEWHDRERRSERRIWYGFGVALIVVLVMLWLVLMTEAVGRAQQPPEPTVTPEPSQPSPLPPVPCPSNDPGERPCIEVYMPIGRLPVSFTAADFGKPPDALDPNAICQGQLTNGTIRYFADGSAPSALVGTLVPGPRTWAADPALTDAIPQSTDPMSTLENGQAIVLYNRDLILGFKAVTAGTNPAEIGWICQL